MTTGAAAKPALEPSYIQRARKLLGERYANRRSDQWLTADKLSQFMRTVDRLLTVIRHGLPNGTLIIEDVTIKGDRVVVRYKAPDPSGEESTGALADRDAVKVSGIDILSLGDGRVIERWRPVYQINTLSQSH